MAEDFKTPVEEALPVYMDLREKKFPAGTLLVIDKSGSMSESAGGYAKIDLARRRQYRPLKYWVLWTK